MLLAPGPQAATPWRRPRALRGTGCACPFDTARLCCWRRPRAPRGTYGGLSRLGRRAERTRDGMADRFLPACLPGRPIGDFARAHFR